jgi:hypothetical protein
MFSDLKKKKLYLFSFILLLIIGIMLVYNFLYLQEIEKNRNIKVVNEVTEIREVEKKIPIPCIKCNAKNGNIPKIENDKETGKTVKKTFYAADGKTIWYVVEYDKDTGNKIKQTEYRADGKTIWYVDEYDKDTGAIVKKTTYDSDGKTIKEILTKEDIKKKILANYDN